MSTKTATKPAAKAAPKKEEPSFKYGIEDVAKALDVKPASARVQLRAKGIKKAGKSYGWNSKSEVEEVVKKLATVKTTEKKAEKKPASKEVKKKAAE